MRTRQRIAHGTTVFSVLMDMTWRSKGLIAAMQHYRFVAGRKDIAFDEAQYDFPDEQHSYHKPRNDHRIGQSGCSGNLSFTSNRRACGTSHRSEALKSRFPLATAGGIALRNPIGAP